jgi:hypothetical protein
VIELNKDDIKGIILETMLELEHDLSQLANVSFNSDATANEVEKDISAKLPVTIP